MVLAVLSGCLGRRGLGRRLVCVGMRDRAHLGNEKRQHSQSCDAKFDAMRPFEQGQPLTQERLDASTVRVNRKPSPFGLAA